MHALKTASYYPSILLVIGDAHNLAIDYVTRDLLFCLTKFIGADTISYTYVNVYITTQCKPFAMTIEFPKQIKNGQINRKTAKLIVFYTFKKYSYIY